MSILQPAHMPSTSVAATILCGQLPRLAFALVGAFFFSTAHAQTTTNLENDFGEGDTATFHMETAWAGTITYDNSAARSSQGGTWPITDNGVTCHITVQVGDAETVTVRCDGPYEPHVEVQAILDGETFTFHILYLGG